MESQPRSTARPAVEPGPSTPEVALGGSPQRPHRSKEELGTHGTIVIKIGGSTLGSRDTTLKDLVALQGQGVQTVIVHGGGRLITEWMERQGVRPKFLRGLRVTDKASLEIVVAVLTGLVNKTLVASIQALGGKAMGMSGADGGMLQATIKDPQLGLVGSVVQIDPDLIKVTLDAECIPVIAPVALQLTEDGRCTDSLLNVNADTAAGVIAAALAAERLVFLTDVEGVLDSSRRLIPRLTQRQARGLVHSRVVGGGMIPKLEACLTAVEGGSVAQIVDGRRPGALMETLAGKALGTRVG